MIEVDTVVECKSKEQTNLEKFKRLQNITYLSEPAVKPLRLEPFEVEHFQPKKARTSFESLSPPPMTTPSSVATPALKGGVKHAPLSSNDFHCKFGMNCRGVATGKCKYKHSATKPSVRACKRGPTCPFYLEGVCAFEH